MILDRKSKWFVDLFKEIKKNKHDNYDSVKEYSCDMAVHAYGEKPEKILERARPREDADIKEYRIDSYEPKTKSKFDEALTILQKMFNEKVYSIQWPKAKSSFIKPEESLEIYCTEEFPDTNSIIGYWKDEGLKKVLSNPNGAFAVLPGMSRGENEFLKPYIEFYKEEQIITYLKNEFYVIHISGELGKDGTYKVFDESGIYTYTEDRTGQSYELTLIGEYIFKNPALPIWLAGGIRENGVFKSYFDAALPFWNKAIGHDSDLDGSIMNCAYPHKWSVEMDCDTCAGTRREDIAGEKVDCRACRGTGKKTQTSGPYKYLSVRNETFNDNPAIVPPMGFVSPDTAILEYLETKVEKLMDQGMAAIKMKVIVGDNQSGKAKEWDRTELHEAIKKVSDLIFNTHLTNSIHYVNVYRYQFILTEKGLSDQEPDIVSPTNFDILTISELTSEISEAETANVSSHYVTALTNEVVGKRFGTNPREKKRLLAILTLDPHPGVEFEEKSLMLGEMTTSKIDVVISNNIKKFVDQAIEKDEKFLDMTREQQREVIRKLAEEFAGEGQQAIEIDGSTDIDGNEVETPVDVEAEAKANLKGSVGGVQGLLSVQAAVAQGTTQYSAALAVLMEIYGFDEGIARAILGSEKEIKAAAKQQSKQPIDDAGPVRE